MNKILPLYALLIAVLAAGARPVRADDGEPVPTQVSGGAGKDLAGVGLTSGAASRKPSVGRRPGGRPVGGAGGNTDFSQQQGACSGFTPDLANLIAADDPNLGRELDLHQATILDNPSNLADWPITTRITALNIGPNGLYLEFSKKDEKNSDGTDAWPNVPFGGPLNADGSGGLQYTLGMAEYINGKWYASAVIEFWRGTQSEGGPPSGYAEDWYYDPSRWGPMTCREPAAGETIGFFVAAGNLRNIMDGSQSPVQERSNVVPVKMPANDAGASYTFR